MAEEKSARDPIVVVDTSELSREDWLNYRRQGIGGSDVAAILGVSPFMTARDLYYDKKNIAVTEDNESNWIAMGVGTLLEPLVGKIFKSKLGCKLGTMKKMLRHPEHPFMQADIDYMALFPDKSLAVLECKTTNYNARDKWFEDGAEIVPFHYELQGRHYMAVMDVDRVYYCCLYGNNENEVIIRRIDRDLEIEAELIALEEDFWVNHVLAEVPPEYTENSELVIESVRRQFGRGDINAPPIELGNTHISKIVEYTQLQHEKSELDKQIKQLEERMSGIKGSIITELGASCFASCTADGIAYSVSYKPSTRVGIGKDGLLRMRENLPDVYAEYVTATESRRFDIRQKVVEFEAGAA